MVGIMAKSDRAIRNVAMYFNNIYAGTAQKDRISCEVRLTLPALAQPLGSDLTCFFTGRNFKFETGITTASWTITQ